MIKLIPVQTELGVAYINPILIAGIDVVESSVWNQHAPSQWYVRVSGADYKVSPEAAKALLDEVQGNKPQVELDSLVLRTIISLERGETANNARPMWRCLTDEGEKVNIFLNEDDEEKDNFHLFEQAGWGAKLHAISMYSTQDLNIQVAIQLGKPTKDGKRFWEIAKVRDYRAANEPF